jgi:hypothetical protein
VPRPTDKDGLSTFDGMERAAEPGEKVQIIDPSRLRVLIAFPDPLDPSHFALRPGDDAELLREWAETKDAQRSEPDRFLHPLTREVFEARVGETKRPR